jgi:hypothetical protein
MTAHNAPERLPGVVEQVAEVGCRGTHPTRWEYRATSSPCDGCRTYAEALIESGLVQQGTTVAEWGVPRGHRLEGHDIFHGEDAEEEARAWAYSVGRDVVHRTRTTYPDRVTDWQPIVPTPTHRPTQATTPQEGHQ